MFVHMKKMILIFAFWMIPIVLMAKPIRFPSDPNYCTERILIKKGQRITVSMPYPIKIAIPEKDQVLDVKLKDQLAVISLDEGLKSEADLESVSLQLMMTNQQIFSCRFYPQSEILEENLIDLIEVKKRELAQPSSVSIDKLIQHISQEDDPKLQNWLLMSHQKWLLSQSNQGPVKIHSYAPRRAQNEFIYLNLYEIVQIGPKLIFKLGLSNRSQPSFKVTEVHVLTRSKSESLPFQTTENEVLAGKKEVILDAMMTAQIPDLVEIKVCDQKRCIAIDLF
jgi:hypothetical protein